MDNNQNNGVVTNSSSLNVNNNANGSVQSSAVPDVNNMSRIIGADNNAGLNVGAFNYVNKTSVGGGNVASENITNASSSVVESLDVLENVNVSSNNKSEEAEKGASNNSLNKEYTGYKEPGKGRFFMLFLLFGGLMAFVYFLPDINEYLAVKKAEKYETNTVITTGSLICDFSNNRDTLTYDYNIKFYYTDSKLEELYYTVTTKGDKTLDLEKLQTTYDECKKLSDGTRELMGVSVTCKLNTSNVVQSQSIDYGAIDLDSVTSAYAEAGGLYPEFENEQSIDTIERLMNASGYSCRRVG